MRNMHELTRVVCERAGWPEFPGRYSYLAAYPNGKTVRLPTLFDESTLVTSKNMHELAHRIGHSLKQRGPNAVGLGLTPDRLRTVLDILLCRNFEVSRVDTSLDAQADDEKIDLLTRQQFAALKGLFEIPRIAVTGPAGSGKTLLAVWRLRALLEEGKRAIFVCFNKQLAAVLRSRNPDYEHSFHSIDKFFVGLCPGEGQEFNDRFFKEILPSRVMDRASSLAEAEKYDAIIVDEGQDFSEEQLIALFELLRKESSQWAFFADWRQDLFRAGPGRAIGAEVLFRLHHNCRNTTRINSTTNTFLGQQIPSMLGMPEGELPLKIRCGSRQGMVQKAWELARQWNYEGGVAILSPYRLENSAMAGSQHGHGLRLSEKVDEIGQPNVVHFSTIRSFKGIEAAAVILVDLEEPGSTPAFTTEDLYVACTRPTSRLALLTVSDRAGDWFDRP